MSVIVRDNVIAGEIDGVGAGDFEEDTLILSNSDIESLLVMLLAC